MTDPLWTINLFLVAATLLAFCWTMMRSRRVWSRPAGRLLRALQEVRENEIAIETLSSIKAGGLAPLVPILQDLLRELKQQKAEVARLDRETGQRVAGRTDALQRKIGSLQVQATRDALTGLFNRRGLEQELARVIAEHKTGSSATDTCLLMIDVDHFKQLNDTLGHAAGDKLLREIAQIIRSTIRDEDLAFRCGGDEFVVLLPGCPLAPGQSIAGRLDSLVSALTLSLAVERPPRLSIGACALTELEHPTAQSLLEVADKRLYAVKTARKKALASAPPLRRAG